jgi:uncharacterized protein (DUF433 family)
MKQPTHIRVDEAGIIRIGQSGVALDEIISAHRKGHPVNAILARFPSLTEQEVNSAIAYHLEEAEAPRGPQQRDAQWRRWNATTAEDNGTDTPPNTPIGKG